MILDCVSDLRQLEKFAFDGEIDSSLSLSGGAGGGWDQFAVNKQKFGVTSDFQEETYTTKLDRSKMTAEQRAKAEKIAREIEVCLAVWGEAILVCWSRARVGSTDQACCLFLPRQDEQRRATGGRFRSADEAEAAGDDQGDEWASDVRAPDGSTRGR